MSYDDYEFNVESSLDEVKDYIADHLDEGVKCPACEQHAQRYNRRLSSGITRALIAHWLAFGTEWGHTAHLAPNLREGAKLRYWGLMEEQPERRADGGKSGWWRITEAGRSFVLGNTTLHRYARVYNNVVHELNGPQTTIQEALGRRFNYAELMVGV